MLPAAGKGSIRAEELEDWVAENAGLPGYHHQTDETVQELIAPSPLVEEEEEAEAAATPELSIAAGINATDTLLALADRVGGPLAVTYEMFRIVRRFLMKQK